MIGSERPWIEVLLLAAGASKVRFFYIIILKSDVLLQNNDFNRRV